MNNDFEYSNTSSDSSVDYVITFDNGEYLVDVFDATISDAEQAYIDTFCFDNLAEAKADMANYQRALGCS